MPTVLVVYTSLFGHVAQLAQAVAAGAQSVPGTTVVCKEAGAATADDARAADALVLGAAVHMGSADYRMRRWVEDVVYPLWLTDALVGKVGAAFTAGGGFGQVGAGCELTQLSILGALAESGMVLVPLPKSTPGAEVAGAHWGPHARTGGLHMEPQELAPGMREAARHHGANVARVAAALTPAAAAAGGSLFSRGPATPQGELLRAFQGVTSATPSVATHDAA